MFILHWWDKKKRKGSKKKKKKKKIWKGSKGSAVEEEAEKTTKVKWL